MIQKHPRILQVHLIVRTRAKQQQDARNLYKALGFEKIPKGTCIYIDNVILKPRNPRSETHMYVHMNTLTKKLATVNTNTLTSHANTTTQIPKMAKLLNQMELHHGATGGDDMNIDFILRASHMTFLTWAPPAHTPPDPTYTPPPIYSLITDEHPTTHITAQDLSDTSHSNPLVGPGSDMEQIMDLLDDPIHNDDINPTLPIVPPPIPHPHDTNTMISAPLTHTPLADEPPTPTTPQPILASLALPVIAIPLLPLPRAETVLLVDSTALMYHTLSIMQHEITPDTMQLIDTIHTYSITQLEQVGKKRRRTPTPQIHPDADERTRHLADHGRVANRRLATLRMDPTTRHNSIAHFELEAPIT